MLNKRFFKTKDEVEVTFQIAPEDAGNVKLVCEANDWSPVKMKLRKKDGMYVTKMRLPKGGQYQFRYLVDDQVWINDDSADAYWENEFGEQNSVVFTTAS